MYRTKVDVGLPIDPERASLEGKNKFLGFWFFLGGETVLFGTLFATYLTLKDSTAGGPTTNDLFELPLVALMTFILLTSSMTSVLAVLAMKNNNFRAVQLWFGITVLLGLTFVGLEISEFVHYYHEKHTFTSSAFGSAFYSLVGFHGGHVLFGALWIYILTLQVAKKGITPVTAPKFYVAGLYWHFVDLVWVFIFTVVYLMGRVG
jgi:cytochrome c oxidase subunit 3